MLSGLAQAMAEPGFIRAALRIGMLSRQHLCASGLTRGLLDCGVLLNQLPDLELVRELVVAHLLERGLRARELDALDALELRRLGGLALVSQVPVVYDGGVGRRLWAGQEHGTRESAQGTGRVGLSTVCRRTVSDAMAPIASRADGWCPPAITHLDAGVLQLRGNHGLHRSEAAF